MRQSSQIKARGEHNCVSLLDNSHEFLLLQVRSVDAFLLVSSWIKQLFAVSLNWVTAITRPSYPACCDRYLSLDLAILLVVQVPVTKASYPAS